MVWYGFGFAVNLAGYFSSGNLLADGNLFVSGIMFACLCDSIRAKIQEKRNDT